MAESVHEILPASGSFLSLFLDVGSFQQPELQQLIVHHHLRFLLPVAMQLAHRRTRDAGSHHSQHGVVNFPLSPGESATDRNGSCQVGVVVRVAGRHIEQDELALAARLIILVVVKRAGVAAGGNDGVVGKPAAATDELTRKLRLNFAFVHARLGHLEHAPKSLVRDGDRFPE